MGEKGPACSVGLQETSGSKFSPTAASLTTGTQTVRSWRKDARKREKSGMSRVWR